MKAKKLDSGDFQLEIPLNGKPLSVIDLSPGDKVTNGATGDTLLVLSSPVQGLDAAIVMVRVLPDLKIVRTQKLDEDS